ncbi:ankyrin, partial [Anaeromyces robustus]
DNEGNTALFYACKNGIYNIVECLIKKHADIQEENHKKQTPLIISTIYNHDNIVELLISYGVNVYNKDIYNNTAFHYACKNNNILCMNIILKR